MNLEELNFSIKADKLFLIVVGPKNTLEQLTKILNKTPTSEKHIMTKINCPSSQRSIELMKEINNIDDTDMLDSYSQKPVLIDNGVEVAHGYINAETDYDDNYYIIQTLTDYNSYNLLSFLSFSLDDDDNPEIIIEDWFKKKLGKISSSVKKSIKLVTVTGLKSNILVISAELKKI